MVPDALRATGDEDRVRRAQVTLLLVTMTSGACTGFIWLAITAISLFVMVLFGRAEAARSYIPQVVDRPAARYLHAGSSHPTLRSRVRDHAR
jgi:hypothetical protein